MILYLKGANGCNRSALFISGTYPPSFVIDPNILHFQNERVTSIKTYSSILFYTDKLSWPERPDGEIEKVIGSITISESMLQSRLIGKFEHSETRK